MEALGCGQIKTDFIFNNFEIMKDYAKPASKYRHLGMRNGLARIVLGNVLKSRRGSIPSG